VKMAENTGGRCPARSGKQPHLSTSEGIKIGPSTYERDGSSVVVDPLFYVCDFCRVLFASTTNSQQHPSER